MKRTSFKMLQSQHRGLKVLKKRERWLPIPLCRQLWALSLGFENPPQEYGNPGTSELLESKIKSSQDGQHQWMVVTFISCGTPQLHIGRMEQLGF